MSDKQKIETEIDIDAKEALETMKKLVQGLNDLNEQGKKTEKTLTKTEKALKSVANGFKGIGLAIKAMGIGLALKAFEALQEIFMSNQAVVDALSTAMTALKIAFNDFVSFLSNNLETVTDFFKGAFENPKQLLVDFGNLIKENLIERFNSLLDTFGYVGEALKALFSGDFAKAGEYAKLAGKELIDVGTGINNTFDRSVNAISGVIDAVVDYTSKTWKQAEAITKLNNDVTLAIANNAKLQAEYERAAELERQRRDNDLLGISERIEANNKLGDILKKQKDTLLEGIDLAIQKAKIDLALNDTIENRVKLTEAETAAADLLNQIEAQNSEQKANGIALLKEQAEINQTVTDGNAERAKKDAEFQAEFIKNEVQKLETLKQINLEQGRLEEERLAKKRDGYAQDTQAYVDAQNEYLNKVQENAQNEIKINAEIGEAKKRLADAEKANREKAIDSVASSTDAFAQLAGEQTALGKTLAIASTTIETYSGASKAFNSMSGIPYVGPVLGGIAAAAAIAAGIVRVKSILAVKTPNSSGGSGGGSTPTVPNTASLPAFNTAQFQSIGKAELKTDGSTPEAQKVVVTNNDIVTANKIDVESKNISTLK